MATSGILTPLIVFMILSRLKSQTLSELDRVQSPTPNGQNITADEDGKFDLFIQK